MSSVPDRSEPSDPVQLVASNRGAMFTVFMVVFIDLLGFGIVLPLLPRFTAEGAIPAGVPTAMTGVLIGIVVSSFSAMQFFFAPFWGRLSDQIGRKPVLLIGLIGSVVFYTLFGIATEREAFGWEPWTVLVLLLISRIGAGIFGANIAAAQAVIADCTPPERRAKGMALVGVAFGIGFTFGPIIGFAALEVFPNHPGSVGYVAAGLSFLALVVAVTRFRETRQPGVHAPVRSVKQLGRLYSALREPGVGLLVLIFFLATLGFANLEGTLALLTKAFGFTEQNMFLIFAFTGFSLMVAQGGIYRPLSKRVSEVTFTKVGLCLMFLGLASLAGVAAAVGTEELTDDWMLAWFLMALATGVFGFAFLTPSVQALISRRADPNRQGEILGVNQAFAALARILGPLLGLSLFPLTDDHLLPYLTAAIVLMILIFLIPRINVKDEAEQPGREGTHATTTT